MFFNRPKIKTLIEKKGSDLIEKHNAHCIAEGNKITAGRDTGERAVVFFVNKKLPKEGLDPETAIPARINGVLTDVIESEEIIPMESPRGRFRPVVGGVSGKVEGGTACSIGLVCYKDGRPHALTNSHCCHFYRIGVDNKGKSFLQPAPSDGGSVGRDVVGTVSHSPILRNDKINKIDSAIIPINQGVPSSSAVRMVPNYTRKQSCLKIFALKLTIRQPSRFLLYLLNSTARTAKNILTISCVKTTV